MQKDTPWDWDSKCQSVFLLLKKAFTSTPILCHFDPSLLIILKCNASDYAIAGILSQLDSRGKDLCPIAFYTCLMIPMELNYDIYNKELLTIIEAFCQWRAYLERNSPAFKSTPTITICSTSQPQNNSATVKLNGLKPSQNMTSPFTTAPGNSAQNPMLLLKDIPSHVAHEFAKDLQFLHQFLQDKINTANQAYSKHANAQ
ncbi:hypothetical protein E4T56_gene18391 [Termitomyces sp. T112]|nr:hypothetical protein E4T56_gene18391 [Termitomyces sp. T112]